MDTARLFGGMCVGPWRALNEAASPARGNYGVVVVVVLFALITELVVVAKKLYWAAVLATDQPVEALGRIGDALWKDARNDLAMWAGGLVVLVVASWVVGRRDARVLAPVALLIVPLCALKLLGVLTLALGFDQWWLPHHAIDSSAIVVDRQVSYLRFAVKQGVAYGPGLLLLVFLIVDLRKERARPPLGFAGVIGAGGLLLVVVLAAVGAGVDASKNEKWLRPAVPGDEILNVRLGWIQGPMEIPRGRFEMHKTRGDVVVLDFWASWCAPCRRSMPEISEVYDEFKDQGLRVIGVNRDAGKDGREKAESALYKIAPSFPSVLDNLHWGDQLGLRSLPTTFVVDRKGVLRHLHLGYTEPDILRGEVAALLKEPP